MHGGHSAVDAVDQAVADGGVHVVCADGGLKGGGVAPRAGIEDLLLDLAVIEGGPGVRELAVAGVEFLEGVLSEGAVRGHLCGDEAAVGEDDLVSFAVCGGREPQVRVCEHAESVGGGLRHLAGGGQKLLHLLAQGVVLEAPDLADRDVVPAEPGLLPAELFEGVLADGEDLRLEESQRLADPHCSALDLQLQLLVMRVPGVLVVAHGRVSGDAVELQGAVVIQLQRREEILRAVGELSFPFPNLRGQLPGLLQFLLPNRLVLVNILQAPGHLYINFFSLGQFIVHLSLLVPPSLLP